MQIGHSLFTQPKLAQGNFKGFGRKLELQQRNLAIEKRSAFKNGQQFQPLQPNIKQQQKVLLNHPKSNKKILEPVQASASQPAPKPRRFLGIDTSQLKTSLKKFVPLAFIFFCILFNYTILRDTKDVLVVTAPGSGAEIIPFLKMWVNLPMAIGFTVLYSSLANTLSPQALFYAVIIPFVAFFGAFAFLFYPNQHILHPHGLATKLLETLGTRFAGPIAIFRNWSFCLFYVMAELWGSVVVSVLFWGFAVQICTMEEAKAFFPLFGMFANLALILSGQTVRWLSNVRSKLPEGVDGWGYSLKAMMSFVVIGGLLIMATYAYMNKTVVKDLPKADVRKKKNKMSPADSFKFLAKQRYIRDLALLVVSYGISINLVEVTWKSKLKTQYPNPNDYSVFMGNFSTATGTFTLLLMLASSGIFRKFGWGVAALITPTVLLVTGIAFFSLILFGNFFDPIVGQFGVTPLLAAVLVGAAQNVFSKGSKYALFDPCKEMAYVPLESETKVKGKAAIDVICNPLGKSGGSLIQQGLIIGFGSLAASTPYLAVILGGIVGVWIWAAQDLNKQFSEYEMERIREKVRQQRKGAKLQRTRSMPSSDGQFIEQQVVIEPEESKPKAA